MIVNVDGHNVMKDLNSGALLSREIDKLSTYKNVKLAKKIEGDRINKIEMDIAEIKNMLSIIIRNIEKHQLYMLKIKFFNSLNNILEKLEYAIWKIF